MVGLGFGILDGGSPSPIQKSRRLGMFHYLRLTKVPLQEFLSPKIFIHPHPNPLPAEGEGVSCCHEINNGKSIGQKLPSLSQGEGPGMRVNAGSYGIPARKVLPHFDPSQRLVGKGECRVDSKIEDRNGGGEID
jgi:hypothetical protein